MIIVDQVGQKFTFLEAPKKVISCVPSITEYLCYLELKDKLIGRTKFCVHPKSSVFGISKIGGTKNLQIDKIFELDPDFVIANKEENTKEDIEKLINRGLKVYVSEVKDIADSFQMMKDIAFIFEKNPIYDLLTFEFSKRIKNLQIEKKKKCLYLIWQNPHMSIGGDTFISSMLSIAGFENILNEKTRYPTIDLENFHADNSPEYIFLSSEPFPFKEKHRIDIQSKFPNSIVKLVDGEYFSWYGNRMLDALNYFKTL